MHGNLMEGLSGRVAAVRVSLGASRFGMRLAAGLFALLSGAMLPAAAGDLRAALGLPAKTVAAVTAEAPCCTDGRGKEGDSAADSLLETGNTNETCVVTGKVCVEPGETRLVDGVPVTRDCWSWRETYACLTPDTDSVNGCETLQEDADTAGPGKCVLKGTECAESVTTEDGETICLSSKETWACETRIDLPPVNAEWTHSTQETDEVVDESACGSLLERDDCTKGKIECTDEGCVEYFYCAGKTATGCSSLEAGGCTITKDPVCDAGVDETCSVKVGEAVCTGDLPEGVIEAGDATLGDQTVVKPGSPRPDVTSCTEMTADLAAAGMNCTQVSQTCVDKDPAIRVINGVSYRASCWGYERVYRCERTEPVSSCGGLEASEGCTEVSRTCEESDETGCVKEKVVYNCGKAESVKPEDAELVEKVDVITGVVEVDTCSELEETEACRKTAEVCTEPGGTKIINGVPVTKDCWASTITYTCGSGSGEVSVDDGCGAIESRPECRLTETKCLGTNEAGECTMLTKTFVCKGEDKEVVTGEVCDSELCIAGVCEPADPETSEDFVEANAILEIIREAGVYGDVTGDMIFKGNTSGCTVKMMGFSCCRNDVEGTSGSMSNGALAIGVKVGVDAGVEFIKWLGSPYVYDILGSFESTQGILEALYGTAGSGVYEPSLSYYGVSVGVSGTGSMTLSFSPAGLLASIALEMAAEYFSCTDEDRLHALRKSRGLCHYVGSYCDKHSGVGCLAKKESWVCFNSRIAKTVQEQGRKQLGIGWGTPDSPVARGFTLKEFQQLKFEDMDLSAVISEVAQQAAKNGTLDNIKVNTEAVKTRAQQRVAEAAAAGDQYTAVETVTGKCFMGEGTEGVNCEAVRALISPYSEMAAAGKSAAAEPESLLLKRGSTSP